MTVRHLRALSGIREAIEAISLESYALSHAILTWLRRNIVDIALQHRHLHQRRGRFGPDIREGQHPC